MQTAWFVTIGLQFLTDELGRCMLLHTSNGTESHMMTKTKKTKRQAARMEEIQNEIDWYSPSELVADTLLKLGTMGFDFSGHGVGGGGEDFSMTYNFSKGYLQVGVCWTGFKVRYYAEQYDDNFNSSLELITGNRRELYAWVRARLKAI